MAQSTSQLEAKLRSAGNEKERMEIKIDLAKAYMRSDLAKAARYAQDAYEIARSKRDKRKQAEIAYLDGEIHIKRRDGRKAEARFKTALANAKEAKDNTLIINSLDALSKVANSNGNHRSAYNYANETVAFLRKNGGGGRSTSAPPPSSSSSSSSSSSKSQAEITKIINDNRQLIKDNQSLQANVNSLKEDLGKYDSERAQLTQRERELEERTKKALSEEREKFKESKDITDARIKRREKEIDKLSKDALKQELMLKEKEQAIKEAEQDQERSNNFLKLMGLGAGFLVITSLLFLGRLRANRRAKKNLEEKNKQIEDERRTSEELLLNILPAPIAKELKENGKAKAQKYDSVSVLFTDFKNFSSIAERLSPEDLVAELDHCFKAFDYIISQYDNIEKIKTIGDAYMCASGLTDRKGLPNDLVNAALEMQEFLRDYKVDRSQKGLPYFEARIGIHTGPVVAGVVGFNKFAYDIWGDTVNIAARMEANSEVGKVNISESTHNQVKYKFDCQPRGKIAAKNKGYIDMYYVNKKLY